MSVELMEVRIKTQLSYVIFVVVYHPPPNKSNGYTIDHIITHVDDTTVADAQVEPVYTMSNHFLSITPTSTETLENV